MLPPSSRSRKPRHPISLPASLAETPGIVYSKEVLGLATGQITAARALGTTVGTVIFVSVFKTKLSSELPSQIAQAAIQAGLPTSSLPTLVAGIATGNVALAQSAAGANSTILAAAGAAALNAYNESFHVGWSVDIPWREQQITDLVILALLGGLPYRSSLSLS